MENKSDSFSVKAVCQYNSTYVSLVGKEYNIGLTMLEVENLLIQLPIAIQTAKTNAIHKLQLEIEEKQKKLNELKDSFKLKEPLSVPKSISSDGISPLHIAFATSYLRIRDETNECIHALLTEYKCNFSYAERVVIEARKGVIKK